MNTVSRWTTGKFYRLLSNSHLSLFPEKSSLCTFLFHGLFRDETEIAQGVVDPQQGITVAHFREFVSYYKNSGYIFVTPQEIMEGLKPGKNYALITFDDGYYNNLLALPVLKEYEVPATFFISANHILESKCFWWDVVYRERNKEGISANDLRKEYASLKEKRNEEIESYLKNAFGPKALRPVGDIDRPFTVDELKMFSMEPFVNIGNHTFNHAILTNYSREEVKSEISRSQECLSALTGSTPSMIAYPNGNYSGEIIAVCKEAGLRSGVTVKPAKNYLPFKGEEDNLLKLNRFTLWGNENIKGQCEFFRSEIHSYRIRSRFNKWNKALCNVA